MNISALTLFIGMGVLVLASYLLILFYSYYYNKYIAAKDLKKKRMFISVGIVTLAWVAATLISVMFAASNGMLAFAATSFALIFGVNYLLVGKTFGYKGKHKVLYSLALAVIINPTWYFMLG